MIAVNLLSCWYHKEVLEASIGLASSVHLVLLCCVLQGAFLWWLDAALSPPGVDLILHPGLIDSYVSLYLSFLKFH